MTNTPGKVPELLGLTVKRGLWPIKEKPHRQLHLRMGPSMPCTGCGRIMRGTNSDGGLRD